MKFHLNFTPHESVFKINHQDEILFIGSCFSEHIASKLISLKFNCSTNPLGIVFNPQSIYDCLIRCISQTSFTTKDVFEKNGLWFSLYCHTSIYHTTQQGLLDFINQQLDAWHRKLKTAKCLIITLGSAYAYNHVESTNIVSNCHKLPNNQFRKQLLNLNSLYQQYTELIKTLLNLNPSLQILFTISPVKHIKDGIVENSRSKAILIELASTLVDENLCCSYFPAYELVSDDLRDYRFYEADLVHPNQQAIDYVWQKFSNSFFNLQTLTINSTLNEINSAKQHKPFQENSEEYKLFKKKYFEKCEVLKKENPWLNLESEISFFK